MPKDSNLPRVLAPAILNPTIETMLSGQATLVPWPKADGQIDGIYCYGHSLVDGKFMDMCGALRVISNHGVGVDHIDLNAARERGIPVGNTPGVLDGAVADMAMTLLLAAARRLTEGERFARKLDTVRFGTNDRHGQEVHGATLGIGLFLARV